MIQKLKKFFVFLTFSYLLPMTSSEAAFNFGGTPAIFCPPSVPSQPAVQVLDLFEAKELENLSVLESDEPVADQILKIESKLGFNRIFKTHFYLSLLTIQANVEYLRAGLSIGTPPDLGSAPVLVPSGCHIGAIGYYDGKKLVISQDAYRQMSNTQKSAFWVHEAMYRLGRFYEEMDSKRTRRLVGNLYAEDSKVSLEKLSYYFRWERVAQSTRPYYPLHPLSNRFINSGGAWTFVSGVNRRSFKIQYRVASGEPNPRIPEEPVTCDFQSMGKLVNGELDFTVPERCMILRIFSAGSSMTETHFKLFQNEELLLDESTKYSMSDWAFSIVPSLR